jgi:hypothetical protein
MSHEDFTYPPLPEIAVDRIDTKNGDHQECEAEIDLSLRSFVLNARLIDTNTRNSQYFAMSDAKHENQDQSYFSKIQHEYTLGKSAHNIPEGLEKDEDAWLLKMAELEQTVLEQQQMEKTVGFFPYFTEIISTRDMDVSGNEVVIHQREIVEK